VANLNNKSYGNLWQSIDSPGDFDTMRLCSMMMRPFSRGVVMGTDEMYWPPDTDAATVSKFTATTVLSGVPAIGANFEQAPRSHSNIVRAWLQFYKAHQAYLTEGDFLPFGDFVFPNHRIESSGTAFVYLRKVAGQAEVPLNGQPETIFLVNCTDGEEIAALFPTLDAAEYQLLKLNELLQITSVQAIRLDHRTAHHAPARSYHQANPPQRVRSSLTTHCHRLAIPLVFLPRPLPLPVSSYSLARSLI
jgi:hypothetical protein